MDEAPIALLDSEEDVRVGGSSNVQKLAVVISSIVEDGRTPVVRAMGVSAVNQALKAIIVAGGVTSQHGVHLVILPGFDVGLDDPNMTCITMRVLRRDAAIEPEMTINFVETWSAPDG